MQYHALLDRWHSQSLLYFPDLPGCQVTAGTPEEALARAPEVVSQHLSWLHTQHLLAEPPTAPIDIALLEDSVPSANGAGALFQTDLQTPPHDYMQNALQIADLTRADLITLSRSLPPESVFPFALGDTATCTVEGLLQHIAELDLWYIASLFAQKPTLRLPDDPVEALEASARAVADGLRSLSTERLQQVVIFEGEAWTPMKLLRRRTGHLREHIPHLQRLSPLDALKRRGIE